MKVRGDVCWLVLVLGVPCLAVQLALPVPRIDADAIDYYSHVRSLYFDHDLDFANEFDHFGILTRYDKIRPTQTGHRRTVFSVGPALLWMPFYAVGDLVARVRGSVEDGYSASHIRSVMIASLVYGVLGLVFVYRVLHDLVPRSVGLGTVVLLQYGTFLYWYLVHEPVMSHAVSFFLSALALAIWWPRRDALTPARCATLGLVLGLATTVRWQSGVLLLLPGVMLLRQVRAQWRVTLRSGVLLLALFGLGVLPQLVAWKAIFGSFLLPDPPQGRDFLRLHHPYLLETLFSSRHGLLYWTPHLWAGFLGLVPLFRRGRWTALAVVLPLVATTYVSACSGDWWAGGSFSNRRFDTVLPHLACGLALTLEALRRLAERRPGVILTAGGLLLALWNGLFMEQYRRTLIPRDDTVAFWSVAENSANLLADEVGTPLAWPANWIFSARYDVPVASYDRMVGKYLFYRQGSLGGVIDLGDDRADPALLVEGWSSQASFEGAVVRRVQGRARLFAPLDHPETLDIIVRAAGTGTLAMQINGFPVARFPLTPSLTDFRVRVPAEHWRPSFAAIVFEVSPQDQALVDRLVFTRVAGSRS